MGVGRWNTRRIEDGGSRNETWRKMRDQREHVFLIIDNQRERRVCENPQRLSEPARLHKRLLFFSRRHLFVLETIESSKYRERKSRQFCVHFNFPWKLVLFPIIETVLFLWFCSNYGVNARIIEHSSWFSLYLLDQGTERSSRVSLTRELCLLSSRNGLASIVLSILQFH